MKPYNLLLNETTGTYKEKGSKFFAYLFPINSKNDFNEKLKDIKKEHNLARHWCYAWRLLENNFLEEKANDDGEPAHSAGSPILNQLKSNNLIQTACVVVRYFGGTKLGIPGLIVAYETSTFEAIKLAKVEIFIETKEINITYNYDQQREIETILKKNGGKVVHSQYDMNITQTIKAELDIYEVLIDKLKNFINVE